MTFEIKHPHRFYKILVAGKPVFYKDRNMAKRARDEAGGGVVMRGPDHWKGESYNRNLNPTPSSKVVEW